MVADGGVSETRGADGGGDGGNHHHRLRSRSLCGESDGCNGGDTSPRLGCGAFVGLHGLQSLHRSRGGGRCHGRFGNDRGCESDGACIAPVTALAGRHCRGCDDSIRGCCFGDALVQGFCPRLCSGSCPCGRG